MGKRKATSSSGLSNVIAGFSGLFQLGSTLVRKTDLFGQRQRRNSARLAYLQGKYGQHPVVQRMMNGEFWLGQTADQLIDSIGRPAAVDDKLLQTKKREVWKYNQTGVNRYRLRITLDDDQVSSWDSKS